MSIIENILTNSILFDLHIHFHITQQATGVTHFVEEESETRAVWQFAQDRTARPRAGILILYLVFLCSKVHNTLSEILKCKQNNLSLVCFFS